MNVAGIKKNDTANAPGVSVSVYVSGCGFGCPNCHNPEAQDFNYGEPFSAQTAIDVVNALTENGIGRSLSLLGGEPLHPRNACQVYQLICYVKTRLPNTKIYLWTGYTMHALQIRRMSEPVIAAILDSVDWIIDGTYQEAERDITLPLRGSKNQIVWRRNIDGIWEKDENYLI